MKINVTLSVPDYIYEFYQVGAIKLGGLPVEEMMERALFMYASIVAAELQKNDTPAS